MNLPFRIAVVMGLAFSLAAAWKSVQFFWGDRMVFSVPAADSRTTLRQAIFLESEIRPGLKLSPLTWESHVQNAGYLAMEEKYDEALNALELAQRYNAPMSAMVLQGSIYISKIEVARRRGAEAEALDLQAKALEMIERLYRMSVADRSVIQHLMRLYDQSKSFDRLREFALEAHMRWPRSMDPYQAIANSYINSPSLMADLPLIMKLLVMAKLSPQDAASRPDPRVYNLKDIEERLVTATTMLGFENPWAVWTQEDLR